MVCSWLSEQNSYLSKRCIQPLILLYWTFCYSHFNVCVHANLLQACLTLCDPVDYSRPGSSVHGILQARILEWIHPGNLLDPAIEPVSLMSPALASVSFTNSTTWEAPYFNALTVLIFLFTVWFPFLPGTLLLVPQSQAIVPCFPQATISPFSK